MGRVSSIIVLMLTAHTGIATAMAASASASVGGTESTTGTDGRNLLDRVMPVLIVGSVVAGITAYAVWYATTTAAVTSSPAGSSSPHTQLVVPAWNEKTTTDRQSVRWFDVLAAAATGIEPVILSADGEQ